MKTPLPEIDKSRRASKEKIDAKLDVEREQVIAAIKAAECYQCRIKSTLSLQMKRELVAAGYHVESLFTEYGAFTDISW